MGSIPVAGAKKPYGNTTCFRMAFSSLLIELSPSNPPADWKERAQEESNAF
jgi:hypothetical protein